MPPTFIADTNNIHVIIETPAGKGSKYVYDPATGMFKLKKMLPLGMIFPMDFGFVFKFILPTLANYLYF
jgi:inorganic pyrophosphatase